MAEPTIVIHNATHKELKMRVGNHGYCVYMTTAQEDKDNTRSVNLNTTCQEYLTGEDSTGKKLIVSTDDCCDYKSITIKETYGQFDVQKVPRRAAAATTVLTPDSSTTSSSSSSNSLGGSDDSAATSIGVLAKKNAKPMQLLKRLRGNLCGKFLRRDR